MVDVPLKVVQRILTVEAVDVALEFSDGRSNCSGDWKEMGGIERSQTGRRKFRLSGWLSERRNMGDSSAFDCENVHDKFLACALVRALRE